MSKQITDALQALATDLGASLPKQMPGVADWEATYRFLQSYEQLMRPHLQATLLLGRLQAEVLLIQDSTEVDSHQHPKTTWLGPVGNGNHHGYLLQTVLAVAPMTLEALGVAHQEPFLPQPPPAQELQTNLLMGAYSRLCNLSTSRERRGAILIRISCTVWNTRPLLWQKNGRVFLLVEIRRWRQLWLSLDRS